MNTQTLFCTPADLAAFQERVLELLKDRYVPQGQQPGADGVAGTFQGIALSRLMDELTTRMQDGPRWRVRGGGFGRTYVMELALKEAGFTVKRGHPLRWSRKAAAYAGRECDVVTL